LRGGGGDDPLCPAGLRAQSDPGGRAHRAVAGAACTRAAGGGGQQRDAAYPPAARAASGGQRATGAAQSSGGGRAGRVAATDGQPGRDAALCPSGAGRADRPAGSLRSLGARHLDGLDSFYANTGLPGHSEAGQFIPYWYREADGSIALDLLSELNDETLLDTGIRAGEYYLCPRETGRACVVDPAPYQLGDKQVMLASFSAPILLNGEFLGIVGSDLSVDFLQSMLERSNDNLFDGQGEQALISGNGRLVAWTGEGAAAGE